MKKKVLWSDFLNPEKCIAINCETEQEANEFLKALYNKGYAWCDGACLTDVNMFSHFKQNTCYCMENDVDYKHELLVVYHSLNYFKDEGFTIYRYSEIEFLN